MAIEEEIGQALDRLVRRRPRVTFERFRRDPNSEIELPVLSRVPRSNHAMFVVNGRMGVVAIVGFGRLSVAHEADHNDHQ